MNKYGFIKLTCVSPQVHIANPKANKKVIQHALAAHYDSDILLFPELSLTGYSCADLFKHDVLLDEAELSLLELAENIGDQLVFVGLPLRVDNALYNCGAVLNRGKVIGIFPKQFLPNYGEFYEARWFKAANGNEPKTITLGEQTIPFGIDLLFSYQGSSAVIVSGCLCEDDWMPVTPSSFQALAGATIQCNLSASNETIGKHHYRLNTLIIGQSGRHISACAYASAGASESTTDLVFGGQLAIAENGVLLENSRRVGDGLDYETKGYTITADIDVKSLMTERQRMNTYADCASRYSQQESRYLTFSLSEYNNGQKLAHKISGTPFVPQNKTELEARCAEIFGIQCAGLKKRLQQLGDDPHIWIGISGGLDSTLAALVALKTFKALGLPPSNIHGLTMPGFGTSTLTKNNADAFMRLTYLSIHEEDICQLALDTFKTQNHRSFGLIDPDCSLAEFKQALTTLTPEQLAKGDLVFENVQARLRTFLLMSHGFVLGTGDLSEMALGWCTYNADHMSMYNVNCSIPKTLVSWLVRHVAEHVYQGHLREVLMSIANTPISPELLPVTSQGEMSQFTEDSLGAYELHDFFLYQMIRKGHSPEKILYLAVQAEFNELHSPKKIKEALKLFYRRFFAQQYKRSCVPDGPKVGSVSLSPRGDWRMPSDAEVDLWLEFD
ncbi:MAG: NAD(+) synthase [Methylococcales bacterium]|nr:NAD(+) synthase [Methylococcales bacterium]